MDSFFPAQLKAKLEEGSSSQQNDTCPETQESENGSGMDIFSQQLNLLMYIINYYNKQVNRPPLLAPVLCLRFYLSFGIKINEDHLLRIANNDEFVEMIEMVTKGDENFDKDVLKKAPLIQNDLINSCSESEVSTESRFQNLAQVFEDIEVEIREGSDEKASCGPHYKSVLKVIDSYDEILDMLDMMANFKYLFLIWIWMLSCPFEQSVNAMNRMISQNI
ncbi:hypothetical protein CTI12_AA202040 [Artemisia annua]|uniref:Uncharacterized protein n=1 Tax=Artemisia annua TaxID=35608 RepID=A0A2U1P1Z7_ARTAN|nr:hypothetical protein CTI12_AA202040 [Artemisia annua]